MSVLMFQERFADKVATGVKRQTIRPTRKRPIKAGDFLSLRKWEGKAYRSKQIELATGTCIGVYDIEILEHTAIIDGLDYDRRGVGIHYFATADGFESWGHMRDWFKETHGLPFVGSLIQWNVTGHYVGDA